MLFQEGNRAKSSRGKPTPEEDNGNVSYCTCLPSTVKPAIDETRLRDHCMNSLCDAYQCFRTELFYTATAKESPTSESRHQLPSWSLLALADFARYDILPHLFTDSKLSPAFNNTPHKAYLWALDPFRQPLSAGSSDR
jgi:hypothetical protein